MLPFLTILPSPPPPQSSRCAPTADDDEILTCSLHELLSYTSIACFLRVTGQASSKRAQGELMKSGTYQRPYKNMFSALYIIARNEGFRCVTVVVKVKAANHILRSGLQKGLLTAFAYQRQCLYQWFIFTATHVFACSVYERHAACQFRLCPQHDERPHRPATHIPANTCHRYSIACMTACDILLRNRGRDRHHGRVHCIPLHARQDTDTVVLPCQRRRRVSGQTLFSAVLVYCHRMAMNERCNVVMTNAVLYYSTITLAGWMRCGPSSGSTACRGCGEGPRGLSAASVSQVPCSFQRMGRYAWHFI